MAATVLSKAEYGIDSPTTVRSMFSRGGWTLAFAIAIFYINHAEYPGPATRLLIALGAIAVAFFAAGAFMMWSSRVAKFQVRDEILGSLQLRGDEKILDLGSGTGLMLIGAAKRLKSGRVIGVDLSGSIDKAKENAKLEGVADKIRVDPGRETKLVYPDGLYDVAVSALAIHQIPDYEDRKQLVREMFRVVKPGGRLAIFDMRHTGEYADILRSSGAKQVEVSAPRFLWCRPARTVRAAK